MALSLSLSIVFLPSCYLCLFIIIFLNVRWGLCNFEGRRREQSRSSRPKLQQRETRADRAKGKKGKSQRPRSNVFLPSFLPVSWIVKSRKSNRTKEQQQHCALYIIVKRDRVSPSLHDLYCTVQYSAVQLVCTTLALFQLLLVTQRTDWKTVSFNSIKHFFSRRGRRRRSQVVML